MKKLLILATFVRSVRLLAWPDTNLLIGVTKKTIYCIVLCFSVQIKAQLDPNLILTLIQVTTAEMNGIGSPGTGSLVFNTTENAVFKYDGTSWLEVLASNSAWKTDGNANTDDTSDFMGTTDSQDLVLKANNIEGLRINETNGYVGLGVVATSPLQIDRNVADGVGILRLNGTEPDINFNDTDGGFNTFTFENAGSPKFALGRRNTDAFYITRNFGGVWFDQTFNILNNNGFIGINTETPDAQLDIESTGVPLRIQPSTTTPTGTIGGQIFVDTDGLLYTYNTTRAKWLSVDRTMVGWGRNNGSASNEYLRQFNGSQSNNNGWRMIRDATITAITVQSNNVDTFDIQIRSNDNAAPILTFTVTAAEGDHDNTINIDVSEGDFIQCFLPTVAGGVSNPQVLVEIAWRK